MAISVWPHTQTTQRLYSLIPTAVDLSFLLNNKPSSAYVFWWETFVLGCETSRSSPELLGSCLRNLKGSKGCHGYSLTAWPHFFTSLQVAASRVKSAPDLGDGASWLLLYGVQIREQARYRGELVHAVIWRNMCFHTLFAGAGPLFSALCCISILKCTELSRTDFYTIPCQINSVTPFSVTSPHVPDVFTSYDFKNVLLYLLSKMVIIKKKWIHF